MILWTGVVLQCIAAALPSGNAQCRTGKTAEILIRVIASHAVSIDAVAVRDPRTDKIVLGKANPATFHVMALYAIVDVFELHLYIGIIIRCSDKAEIGAAETTGITRILERVTFNLPKYVRLPVATALIIDQIANVDDIAVTLESEALGDDHTRVGNRLQVNAKRVLIVTQCVAVLCCAVLSTIGIIDPVRANQTGLRDITATRVTAQNNERIFTTLKSQ